MLISLFLAFSYISQTQVCSAMDKNIEHRIGLKFEVLNEISYAEALKMLQDSYGECVTGLRMVYGVCRGLRSRERLATIWWPLNIFNIGKHRQS